MRDYIYEDTYAHIYEHSPTSTTKSTSEIKFEDEIKFGNILPPDESEIIAEIHMDERVLLCSGRFTRVEFGENVGFVGFSSVNGAASISVKREDIWRFPKKEEKRK